MITNQFAAVIALARSRHGSAPLGEGTSGMATSTAVDGEVEVGALQAAHANRGTIQSALKPSRFV